MHHLFRQPVLATLLVVASAGSTLAADPVIAVQDQRVESGNIVKVEQVTSPGSGFVVIHTGPDAAEAKPGTAIGYALVNSGSNSNVSVKLEHDVKSGETLVAVLHEDSKSDGMFDATADKPLAKPDGATCMAEFKAK